MPSPRIEPRPDGVLFLGADQGNPLPTFPLEEPGTPSSEIAQLEALWTESRLKAMDGSFFLPLSEYYQLTQEERERLGLPDPDARIQAELRTVGGARTPDFGVRPILTHPELGLLPPDGRTGAFIQTRQGLLAAPERLSRLLEVLDRTPPTDPSDRLAYIGDVKVRAADAGATLDFFLQNEEIIRPERIGVEVEIDPSAEGTLSPTLESASGPVEIPGFTEDEQVARPFYFKPDGLHRKRVVLDAGQREAARTVRSRPPLKGAQLLQFLDNPEAFLPESLSLDQFSPRVRGFIPKRYNSQPYVAARESGKRDWFVLDPTVELAPIEDPDWAQDKDKESRDSRGADPTDPVPTPKVDPEEYRRLCQQVVDSGEGYQQVGEDWIFIDPNTAEKYLETFQAAEKNEEGEWLVNVARHPFVLDVISNLEELEYSETVEPQAVPDVPDYAFPKTFGTDLYQHQAYGYRWLRYLHEKRLGGLLADDMGLGKTVQVLALLAALAEEGRLTPSLLVAPVALIENWQRELDKFAPIIGETYRHQGPDRLRSPDRIRSYPLVMTTYQTLRCDQLMLGQIDWEVVACDEAQYVKNPTAQSTSAVKALKSRHRLAITGTPVENGLSELWCIVDFAQPGKLSSQSDFRNTFERPFRDADPDAVRALATELQKRLTPHYVRRLKEDVLQLPPKETRRTVSSLSSRQREQYVRIVRLVRSQEMTPLEALNRLIQICSHPELQEPTNAGTPQLLADSPKLEATLELLQSIREKGEKAVIFTRFRRMQQILQQVLSDELGIHAPLINGTIGGPERVQVVDRFNRKAGFGGLVVSPDAGGVGLNITGANHVLHYTRLWNPAKENQATDRVHRIGQGRPVTVYYPVVTGEGFASVEERLDELLEEKLELARNVLWPRDRLEIQVEELAGVLFEGSI